MNLVASLVVRNELGRYLEPCIAHLLDFCDRVVVLDDGSDDGTREWLAARMHDTDFRVVVGGDRESTFFKHEGRTRQRLLEATLAHDPSHVLSIDADEFVEDGQALRESVEANADAPILPLLIEEVWNANARGLEVREDGGWRSHAVPFLWRVDPAMTYRMMDRALACRRVPTQVLHTSSTEAPVASLLHFGWTDPATRVERHARYATHDGGRFHRRAHLDSILAPDSRCVLRERPWPRGEVFDRLRERFAAVAA